MGNTLELDRECDDFRDKHETCAKEFANEDLFRDTDKFNTEAKRENRCREEYMHWKYCVEVSGGRSLLF